MVKQKAQYTIPQEIAYITKTLQKANFEAYLVGGCVRDLIMGITPKDWDITTNANPNQIQALFEKTFYENEYGTVGVVNEETKDPTLETVEVHHTGLSPATVMDDVLIVLFSVERLRTILKDETLQ
jgi:hypothetical protein